MIDNILYKKYNKKEIIIKIYFLLILFLVKNKNFHIDKE